ncbi:MAG: YbaB/EbfC family nucleoid-associated protein [Bacteroidia bacterium]|nr:YbaB/EbfC family nucleoid-associated protein [Bacteroidia bacterium]
MFGKLAEAKKMAEEMKQKLAAIEVEGVADGGKVKVRANGNKEVTAIEIAPELLKPENKEEVEELLQAAINRAVSQAEGISAAEMRSMMGTMMPGIGNLFS